MMLQGKNFQSVQDSGIRNGVVESHTTRKVFTKFSGLEGIHKDHHTLK